MLLARPKSGSKPEQHLAVHSCEVGNLASSFASKWGCPFTGLVLGILHDLGKSQSEWQRIIYNIQMGLPAEKLPFHSAAGALFASRQVKQYNNVTFNPMAFAIIAHHTGLPANPKEMASKLKTEGFKEFDDCDIKAFVSEVESYLEAPIPYDRVEKIDYGVFSCAMNARFLLSAIVDADRLNAGGIVPKVSRVKKDFEAIHKYINKQEAKAKPTTINKIRSQIRKDVLAALDGPVPGAIRATIPTGGGKTWTLGEAAMKIATLLGKDRMISCVQFCEIIKQTASEYKEIFGHDNVLEHHGLAESSGLSLENWDHGVIVTSIVQFYESLFTNKAARARKLHNIANSVIVIDEIQTLPINKLEPLLYVMNELINNYGCIFILSSATQPDFEYKGFENKLVAKEIIPDIFALEKDMKRIEYFWKGKMDKTEVCQCISKENQCLLIVNSKKQAARFYTNLKSLRASGVEVYHLSTNMTPAHRERVIGEVKSRLSQGLGVIVVSTCLIEAGINIDFPVVWRDIAGLDSIIQAAGRCNREGGLSQGNVFVVDIIREEDEGVVPEIASRAKTTMGMIKDRSIDIDSSGVMTIGNREYREFFHRVAQVTNPDKCKIISCEKNLDFKGSASGMKIIDNKKEIPIIIACHDDKAEVEDLLKSMMGKAPVGLKHKFRKLQKYEVVLRADERDRTILFDMCDRVDICDSMYVKNGDENESFLYVLRNSAFYDSEIGIMREAPVSAFIL